MIYGWELIMDVKNCNDNIGSDAKLKQFAKELCEAIDMKAYGEPIVAHFGHESATTSGYTLVQLIETSNINGHFSDYYKTAHLNVFSCKPYDKFVVLAFVDNFFEGEFVEEPKFIERLMDKK